MILNPAQSPRFFNAPFTLTLLVHFIYLSTAVLLPLDTFSALIPVSFFEKRQWEFYHAPSMRVP